MTDTLNKYGRTFRRTADGGWLEDGAMLPERSTARIYDGAVVTKEAAATMYGGVFRGGVFRDGVFWGGEFWDGEFRSSPACAQRSDGHMFVAKVVNDDLRIWAGCRNFSWEEAVAHWNDQHRHGAESQRIIHFLKAQAEAEVARYAETDQ